jgi:glycosyltransferase involved in cell wall biosynthesis
MKALMLSHSDGGGGAGRASYRLLQALETAGVDARLHVDFKNSDDPRVFRNQGVFRDATRRLRITADEIPAYIARFPQPRLFSPGIVHAMSAKRINNSDADVVILQWVNFGYLSTRQIGLIRKPLTWSMHDMWAFTGGMNYADDSPDARWRHGFTSPPPPNERGWWDVDRWVWRRKSREWTHPITLIASSHWMAELAHASPLTRNWPVAVIPNAVDTQTYSPASQHEARIRLNVPLDEPVIAAFFPKNLEDSRKGFDLFLEALHHVATDSSPHVIIAGHDGPPAGLRMPDLTFQWLGFLDDAKAIDAYRSADVVAVPSRQDNSPQTATEALSCGTPVVAFDCTGLPDFVLHEQTGFLAQPFDTQGFAYGLTKLLNDSGLRARLSASARETASDKWSYQSIGRAHRELFDFLITH